MESRKTKRGTDKINKILTIPFSTILLILKILSTSADFLPRSPQLRRELRRARTFRAIVSHLASISSKPSAARASTGWPVLLRAIGERPIRSVAGAAPIFRAKLVDHQSPPSQDIVLSDEKSRACSWRRDRSSRQHCRFHGGVSRHRQHLQDRHSR